MRLFDIFKKKSKPIDNKYVFDKAKFHDNTIAQLGLNEEQSFVHTGLFFAWLVNHDLMSDFFVKESGDNIQKLKERKISPSSLYMEWDGVLLGEMLNEQGFNFALHYFDFDKGSYVKEYEGIFGLKRGQIFTVKDSWVNYEKIKPMIDAAYERWRTTI